jgi:hypothetical protein
VYSHLFKSTAIISSKIEKVKQQVMHGIFNSYFHAFSSTGWLASQLCRMSHREKRLIPSIEGEGSFYCAVAVLQNEEKKKKRKIIFGRFGVLQWEKKGVV